MLFRRYFQCVRHADHDHGHDDCDHGHDALPHPRLEQLLLPVQLQLLVLQQMGCDWPLDALVLGHFDYGCHCHCHCDYYYGCGCWYSLLYLHLRLYLQLDALHARQYAQ